MPLKEHQIQNLSIIADCVTAIQLHQKIRRINGPASASIFSSLFSHAVQTAHTYFQEQLQNSIGNDFAKIKKHFKQKLIDQDQTKAILNQNVKFQEVLMENKNVKKILNKGFFKLEKQVIRLSDDLNKEFGIAKKKKGFKFSIFGKFLKKFKKKKDSVDAYLEAKTELELLKEVKNCPHRKLTGKT